MKKNPVVHFEIAADDTKRAQKFYESAFDWKMNEIPEMQYTTIHTAETDENNMVKTPGAINGGIMKRGSGDDTVNLVVSTDNIEESKEKVEKAGGKIVMDITDIPTVGKYFRAKDTEGNIVGVLQPEMK